MLESFHFIRPLWLLALIPLALLAWRVLRQEGDNAWQRIVDARLLPLLMVAKAPKSKRGAVGLVVIGWLVATLALADPTWQRRPRPVYQTNAARVVVLDLSSSMNGADLKPSRIARARYKVEDVLALGAEGQTGLVVYAGDAYVVTPLTRDVNTIRSQLNALAPNLMPSDGDRADLGLRKAEELLRHAGLSTGQVLLIADGVGPDALAATERAAAHLYGDGYRVSVLDVGTGQIAGQPGTAALRSVAQAGGGGDLSINDGIGSLRAWLDTHGTSQASSMERSSLSAQGWEDEGPWLVLLLLPLAALAFRRNWLLSVMLLPLLMMHPRDAMASTWTDLWQRPEQQAAQALHAGDYARAAQLASDAERRGSAQYKRGNYQLALDDFSHAAGAQADYNRGNALAKLGRYPDAISAYDKALKEDPGNADARANKGAVEALLKQQQRNQPQQPQPNQSQQQSKPGASSSKGDGRQNPSSQGKGQDSAASKEQGGTSGSGAGKQGKPGDQGSASSANSQPTAQAQAQRDGGTKGQASPDGGKTGSAHDATAGQQGAANASPAPPPKPGNEFADAARKLAAPGASTQSEDSSPAGAQGGVTGANTQAAANNRQGTTASSSSAQPLPSEEQLAAEQWLRRIPDDPGGLLRRKFLYQYRQRAQQSSDDRQ